MSNELLDPDLYAAPAAATPEKVPERDWEKASWGALKYLGVAVLIFVFTFVISIVAESKHVATFGFGLATLLAITGAVRGIVVLVQRAIAPGSTSSGFIGTVALGVVLNGFMTLVGAVFAYIATVGFSRGRQLRRFGRVLLPRVEAGGAWSEVALTVDVDDAVRPALARQWRENGRTEHASVAAFARLTLDLMALGAPPALVVAANRDALDEIRHAELCFSLACALDGHEESPAAFPEASRARTLPSNRTLALAALAVDSLVDGALNEGVSARVIAKLAKRCEEPQIRAILKEIAADEGRHAAHGWDVVEWCLAEGGDSVAAALEGALKTIPRGMTTAIPEPAVDGGWERFGIHGRALEGEMFADTRADLVRRVAQMVGARGAMAA
jgi:hypothetical protein